MGIHQEDPRSQSTMQPTLPWAKWRVSNAWPASAPPRGPSVGQQRLYARRRAVLALRTQLQPLPHARSGNLHGMLRGELKSRPSPLLLAYALLFSGFTQQCQLVHGHGFVLYHGLYDTTMRIEAARATSKPPATVMIALFMMYTPIIAALLICLLIIIAHICSAQEDLLVTRCHVAMSPQRQPHDKGSGRSSHVSLTL